MIFTAFLLLISLSVSGQKKKAAVVTFYVDKHISFAQQASGVAFIAGLASLAEDSSFNLTPVLYRFHDIFFKEYAPQLPFDLLPEEEVINNPEYIKYESYFGESKDDQKSKFLKQYITYPGYKPLILTLASREKQNTPRMLEIFSKSADGVMFVYLSYEFVTQMAIGGVGSASIRAYLHMVLFNKEGKRVFSVNEYGMSDGNVPVVMGFPALDPAKLIPLCQSASDKVMRDLVKKLPKLTKKVEKKFI